MVKTSRAESGAWRVAIYFRWPGSRRQYRERRRAPAEITSKSAAHRWAETRQAYLLAQGEGAVMAERAPAAPAAPDAPPVPTLRDFGPRWIEGYARASRQKASGIDAKESILRMRLYPELGDLSLDQITPERLALFQASLTRYSEKTVNNTLSTLGKLLKVAVDWRVIDRMPCTIRLVKAKPGAPRFLEIEDFDRLVTAATAIDTRTHVLVLLGGHGGLRRGELIGLRWSDVDFRRRQLLVSQAVWRGVVDMPKSGKPRIVDMSSALENALKAHPKTGERVLCADGGTPATAKLLRTWLARAARSAGIPHATGALHVLRHTCGSSLAALGAPPRAIQALLGHADLNMTLRYMSLTTSSRRDAVDLFDVADRGKDVARLATGSEKA
jgi:integrase